MLGLVKKDLLMMKSNIKLIIILLIGFGIMSFQNESNISFFPIFISTMLVISTFSYDEYNQWTIYAATLPNGKKNTIKSKYTSAIIIVLIATLISIITSSLVGYINNDLNIENILSEVLGSIFAVTVIIAIMYPTIFKMGLEKGRLSIFIGIFIIVAIIQLIFKNIPLKISSEIIGILNKYYLIIIPLSIIVLLTISYKISQKVYLKKEL